MSQLSRTNRRDPPDEKSGVERRAALRYPIGKKALWNVTLFLGGSATEARVRDISTTGIGLLMPEPIETGTRITVELTNKSRLFSCSRIVRVVYVDTISDGQYFIGCEFSTPLTYDQIYALMCK